MLMFQSLSVDLRGVQHLVLSHGHHENKLSNYFQNYTANEFLVQGYVAVYNVVTSREG